MRTQNTNSIEAYNNMKPKIKTDHDLILSVLKKDKILTYKEIGYAIYKQLLLSSDSKAKLKAYAWKYDPNKVSRRMKELVRLKRVKIVKTRKCSIAGSNCSTYILL